MSNHKGLAVGGEAAHPGNGMAVANGKHGAPQIAEWDAKASLKLRIFRAQFEVAILELDSDVKIVTKEGKTFGYKGISAAQVVARAKAALISHGVLYTPAEDKSSITVNGNKTSIWIEGHFENVDNPSEAFTRGAWGSGTDNADNGFAKAFTNANKQILAKTLQMTTVEDEKTNEVAYEPDNAEAIRKEAKQDQSKTLQVWATNYKAALNNAKTLKELMALQTANKEQLLSEDTPEVTRDFFIDLIEGRKKVLGGENVA